jgi:hypothetical protein
MSSSTSPVLPGKVCRSIRSSTASKVCMGIRRPSLGLHGDGEGAVAVWYDGEQLQGAMKSAAGKVCVRVSSSTAGEVCSSMRSSTSGKVYVMICRR